jgi:predicted MFS family arabinose efflux permease
VSGLGVAIGPVTGGFLLEHFWWGSVFLVNVPFALATLASARWLVPESRDPEPPRLDLVGAGLSIAALTSLVWAVIEAPSYGWTDGSIVAAFGAAALLGAAFVLHELRTPAPMLDVRLFRNARFSGASASVSLVFFALMGTIFFLTQYLQLVLGYSPLEAGVRVSPIAAGLIVGAGLSTRLNARIGTKLVVAAGLATLSTALLLLSTASASSAYGLIALVLVLMGLGMGTAMAPATDSVMGALPLEKASVGSAMNDTTRMVGGSLGVAVLGSVVSSVYSSSLHVGSLPGPAAAAAKDSLGGALQVARGNSALIASAEHAFVSGMTTASVVAAGIALAGALVALIVLPARERTTTVELPVDERVPELLAA